MSKWTGKFVIGLTGNIGTGKSVVRKMLEHLGSYGIDADALSHRVIVRGAPGYQPVLDYFGRWIVGADGEIDRGRLGKLVFSDPAGMMELEKIIHPIVRMAIDLIIKRARHRVITIEAIKLIEGGIYRDCDSLWVTTTSAQLQLTRLVQKRGMTQEDARQRITAQAPQQQKLSLANVVINNSSTFEDTWKQVVAAWKKFVPPEGEREAPTMIIPRRVSIDDLIVTRGKPQHSPEIAEFINRLHKSGKRVSAEDIMQAFGEKAFLLLKAGQNLVGLVGWQVENLVACTQNLEIDPGVPLEKALPVLIKEMENASIELQCEASLIFVAPEISRLSSVWQSLGYETRSMSSLQVPAWHEAAQDSMMPGLIMMFKQLRQDRILRPI
jgi:dephospho-CoA kinase